MAKDTGNLARQMAAAPLKSMAEQMAAATAAPSTITPNTSTADGDADVVDTSARPLAALFGMPAFKLMHAAKEYENERQKGTFSTKVAEVNIPLIPADISMKCFVTRLRKRERDADGEYDNIELVMSMPSAGKSQFAPTAFDATSAEGVEELVAWRDLICNEYRTYSEKLSTGRYVSAAAARTGVTFKQRVAAGAVVSAPVK